MFRLGLTAAVFLSVSRKIQNQPSPSLGWVVNNALCFRFLLCLDISSHELRWAGRMRLPRWSFQQRIIFRIDPCRYYQNFFVRIHSENLGPGEIWIGILGDQGVTLPRHGLLAIRIWPSSCECFARVPPSNQRTEPVRLHWSAPPTH